MKYKGILAKKKPYQTALLAVKVIQSGERTQAQIDLEAEYAKAVDALFGAHDVEAGNWHLLAIKLAVAHVPGFQTEKVRGRKNRWDPYDRASLRVRIDEYCKKNPDMSISRACGLFAKKPEWKSKVHGSGGDLQVAEALRRQYYEADERYIRYVQDARALGRALETGIAKAVTSQPAVKNSSNKLRHRK